MTLLTDSDDFFWHVDVVVMKVQDKLVFLADNCLPSLQTVSPLNSLVAKAAVSLPK